MYYLDIFHDESKSLLREKHHTEKKKSTYYVIQYE